MTVALAMQFRTTSGDIVAGKTLATDEWLNVVVFTSLFTDAYVEPDERPAGEMDHGGYWGDALGDRALGSKLWLLRRAKMTRENVLLARDYCLQALAWLVSTGRVRGINVTCERIAANRLAILVQVTRNDGTTTTIKQEFASDAV